MILYSSVFVGRNVPAGARAKLFATPQGHPAPVLGEGPTITQTAEHTSQRLASEMEVPIEDVAIYGYGAELILHDGYTSPVADFAAVAALATTEVSLEVMGRQIFAAPLFSVVGKDPGKMVYLVKVPIIVRRHEVFTGHLTVGRDGFDLGALQRVKVNVFCEALDANL